MLLLAEKLHVDDFVAMRKEYATLHTWSFTHCSRSRNRRHKKWGAPLCDMFPPFGLHGDFLRDYYVMEL